MEELIPIDKPLEDFKHHLDANARIIFSAKFGDGKSFFLSKFMQDDEIKDKYEFITIYPVNYQVMDNYDVFELIKRDVLFQLALKKIIPLDIEVADEVALAFYIQSKFPSFAEDVLTFISALNFDAQTSSIITGLLATKKFFKSLRKKIKDFAQEGSKDNVLEKFCQEQDKKPALECDAITKIIKDNIAEYKNKTGKQVVLVIEDLDRLDPAHLFRIMNIFSAHIDYYYKVENCPDDNLGINRNKFDFDKVVFVMHYENVKKIFMHFYGEQTDFDGYINKFCTSTVFRYSLKEELEKYVYKLAFSKLDMSLESIQTMLYTDDITAKTIRTIVHAFENINNGIVKTLELTVKNKIRKVHTGFIKLLYLLRIIGIDDSEIEKRIIKTITPYNPLLPYSISYISNPDIILYLPHNSNGIMMCTVNEVLSNGIAEISYFASSNDKNGFNRQVSTINKVFDYVVK